MEVLLSILKGFWLFLVFYIPLFLLGNYVLTIFTPWDEFSRETYGKIPFFEAYILYPLLTLIILFIIAVVLGLFHMMGEWLTEQVKEYKAQRKEG